MEKSKNFIMIRFFIFLCFFLHIKCYYFQNTHFLISAKLNGTSPVVSLNKLQPKSNYVNFVFDFLYHSNNVPDSKNSAYFKISTNLDIPTDEPSSNKSIIYRFFEEDWTKVIKKNVAKKLEYKTIEILSKEKSIIHNEEIYTYKFMIEKQNDKDNTLIIKVPTQKIKEGFISIENILEIN